MIFVNLQQPRQESTSFMAEIRISSFHLRKEGAAFRALLGPVHNRFTEVCLTPLAAWKNTSERKKVIFFFFREVLANAYFSLNPTQKYPNIADVSICCLATIAAFARTRSSICHPSDMKLA